MVQFVRGVYQRFDATVPPVPVMVDVSRSGREYPEEFRSMVPFTVLHDNVSMYVDDLWGEAPNRSPTRRRCSRRWCAPMSPSGRRSSSRPVPRPTEGFSSKGLCPPVILRRQAGSYATVNKLGTQI